MHLIRKMFYFCFQGNHSHNLRLKVYLVVSLVISYVKKDNISILEKQKYFVKMQLYVEVFAEKPKVCDKKHFFPKSLKEATNDYFLYA